MKRIVLIVLLTMEISNANAWHRTHHHGHRTHHSVSSDEDTPKRWTRKLPGIAYPLATGTSVLDTLSGRFPVTFSVPSIGEYGAKNGN